MGFRCGGGTGGLAGIFQKFVRHFRLRLEGAGNGTAFGNFEQALALVGVEGAGKADAAVEDVAFEVVFRGGFFVHDRRLDMFQWPAFLGGVHAEGHVGAGAEGGAKEFVGCGAGVVTRHGGGFVGGKGVRAHGNALTVRAGGCFGRGNRAVGHGAGLLLRVLIECAMNGS